MDKTNKGYTVKKILALLFILIPAIAYSATTSTNGYFYLPDVGDSGSSIHSAWVAVQEATDGVIQANVDALTNSSGLAGSLSDETGTGLAVFGTQPSFVDHINISTSPSASGIRASGAIGIGKLGGIGNTNNEGLTLDFESNADVIAISSHTGASQLEVSGMGFKPDAVNSDPCGTYGEGAIFYNYVSGYPCFCDNSGADLKMTDNTTACF